jgi:hypothetical protein
VTYDPGSRVFRCSSKDANSASDRSDDEIFPSDKHIDDEDRRVRSRTRVTFNSGSASSSQDIRQRQVSEFEHYPPEPFELPEEPTGASGNAQQADDPLSMMQEQVEEDMILPPETKEEARRRHRSSSYRGPIPITPAPKGKSTIGIFSGRPITSTIFGSMQNLLRKRSESSPTAKAAPQSPPEEWDCWDKETGTDDPPHMPEPEQSGPYTDCPYQHAPAAPRSPSSSSSQNAPSSWKRDFGGLIQEGDRRPRPIDAPIQDQWEDNRDRGGTMHNYIDNHGREQEVAAPPDEWRQGWWDYASDRWSDWQSQRNWWS